MLRLKYILSIFLFVFVCQEVDAAKINSKKSEKLLAKALIAYRSGELIETESLLLKSLEADSTNLQAYLLLADISSDTKNIDLQIWALSKVIEIDGEAYPEAYKYLAEACSRNEDFGAAIENWNKYNKETDYHDSMLVYSSIDKCRGALKIKENERNIEIIHLDSTINTDQNEYWPVISTDDSILYFTRLIAEQGSYAYERLYYSKWHNSFWNFAEQMLLSDNNTINEGALSMTADGNMIFLTACSSDGGLGSCDIYYMLKVDGNWISSKNAGAPLNTKFWEAQPSVSAYGDKVYFTSNRPGGLGGSDIWVCDIERSAEDNLIFSEPVNLGIGVNSKNNDYSPFIHADDKTLYFASEGRHGVGKSDLFIARFDGEVWSDAINLGIPINSKANDDGLVISPSGKVAVFASNREGAIDGSMDLFQFDLPKDISPSVVSYIRGVVLDKVTGDTLNAEIEIQNLDENIKSHIFSDKTDGYITTVKANCNYALNVAEKGYMFYSKNINLKEANSFNTALDIDILLEPIKPGAKLVLNNIFFDFNDYTLQKESEPELRNIMRFLKLNPKVRIEISGHTDNVGSKDYNMQLSQKRAQAIADYLSREINPGRFTVVGYGSHQPVANNNSDEGRSKNRRTELQIL